MTWRFSLTSVLGVVLAVGAAAYAEAESIKFTTDALGLGGGNINSGQTIDADIAGKLVTSPTTGEGSILWVQQSGLAGWGTALDPLLVTVTAQGHLDNSDPGGLLPAANDFYAGILTISKESLATPDGKQEGLGVKAFTVGADFLRDPSGAIEGSSHVSGGTDDPSRLDNGAPHVDERVYFDFNTSAFDVIGHGVEVLLSDFLPTDIVDLHIDVVGKTDIDLAFLGTGMSGLFEQLGGAKDKLWKLKLSGVSGLAAEDLIEGFWIGANDDDPAHPKETAEHFLISGLELTPTPSGVVPAPSSLVGLLSMGLLGGLAWRRRRRAE